MGYLNNLLWGVYMSACTPALCYIHVPKCAKVKARMETIADHGKHLRHTDGLGETYSMKEKRMRCQWQA